MAEDEVVLLAVVVVDGVGFVGVRRCVRAYWSRVGLPRVLLAPPAWRHPTGFAGVSFATVSGLVVGWSSRCLLMWLSLSMAWVIRVFEVVVVAADRSVGCPGGRCRC